MLKRLNAVDYLDDSLIGIEKESLRVSHEANISQGPHPSSLGAALTNRYITTDYSEALIEFITPPENSIFKAMQFLEDLHRFTYKRLDNEMFWATSMPCVIKGESNIPIAQYGSSNLGRMKTVYREGLAQRYGKTMQIIAGVHYNFSFSEKFWQALYEGSDKTISLQNFISEQYFSLIRNLLRVGWLIPYLFGASPAVCKSFFGDDKTDLSAFDKTTYYEPYATSLRMSDIGYQNNKENEKGIKACYDSLEEYIANIKYAIETPCPDYEKIGIKENGRYKQLNSNILQIENEYYSTVRPKQLNSRSEQPIHALANKGVRYIELRSLDVNAYDPIGINAEQLHFLETLMLFCLLTDSPYIEPQERKDIDDNEMLVALRGREPGLELSNNGDRIALKEWAGNLFIALEPVAAMLDEARGSDAYGKSCQSLAKLVANPDNTPSARMLKEMKANQEGFHHFAKRVSLHHENYIRQSVLSKEATEYMQQEVERSLSQQVDIEQSDTLPFDKFLDQYFNQ